MDNQLKTFNYKYRKRIVGRKTIEYDPIYLTQLIYTYFNTPGFGTIDGEFIELSYYAPTKQTKLVHLANL